MKFSLENPSYVCIGFGFVFETLNGMLVEVRVRFQLLVESGMYFMALLTTSIIR